MLLIVLGYEGIGALLGSSVLIAAPDGRLMGMTVNILHGVRRLPGCHSPGSLPVQNITINQPTPQIGVWERINIGLFLLWVVILAIVLYTTKPARVAWIL